MEIIELKNAKKSDKSFFVNVDRINWFQENIDNDGNFTSTSIHVGQSILYVKERGEDIMMKCMI